ncbi:helix-turn-helix transcriptional regulator [Pradoshia sp.]
MEESKHLRNQVRVLRAERKMTQQDLAAAVGVSRQTIISIEKGKYTPSLVLAFEIAHAFHVGITEVFQYEKGEN